jgi:hypothetical protein
MSDRIPNTVRTFNVTLPTTGPAVRVLEHNPDRVRAIIQNVTLLSGCNLGDNTVKPTAWTGGFTLGAAGGGVPALPSRIELFTTGEVWASGSEVNLMIIEEIAE